MEKPSELLADLAGLGRQLREHVPAVYEAYGTLHRAAMADGALPARTKELIALAIAVTRECDGCVASHARAAARRGATTEEVAEAMGVAILMNGGPGTVWGPRALHAFEEAKAAMGAGPNPAAGEAQ
ncbi:carboxymuconolactone decarboxylase family protein [Aciditerrimonas ferrireducens]|jgi:AhpD family alkylhydroperoxidase|uniref:carboxymuconolactone decarboxylase family protein n=1 Tax=Aciditerrimonas ferrireducens TaxID=667306 RepID=UPI002002B785|nr:carboxymuconolactone decarboxylase family protein [Aciditerrimonas ferrireducens]MCK4177692.1 carboxymuconolactone decarboxylase family protein [Aciditerrimonas ferrireducens]